MNDFDDVELQNVTKKFDDVVAVKDVVLSIRKGEFFSLLGPSGCGKTTILRMVAGFENPTSGYVLIAGRSMQNIPPYKRETNMVFQQLALFPHLNVFENVAFGLRLKKVPRQNICREIGSILEIVELTGLEGRRIFELSGGQQQRVAIARALINKPRVLLLDEPLASLDAKLRVQMQLELKQIQMRVGTTFIYVTHDQVEALTMSDRIAVLRDGVIEQVGTGNEIYESPRTRFVADFIGDTNLLWGTIESPERVNVSGLSMIINDQENVTPNSKVEFSLRPEKIHVEHVESCRNRFQAVITELTYQGAITKLRANLNDQVTVLIHCQNYSSRLWSVGQKVAIGWSADAMTALRDSESLNRQTTLTAN